MAKKKTEKASHRPWSLAWLAELFYTEGFEAAKHAFDQIADGSEPYTVIKAGQGQPSLRTDVAEKDEIAYESYDPPALWQAPYSLKRVRFEAKPKDHFMAHAGEEVLVPLSGSIVYNFFWTEGKRPPSRTVLEAPLVSGSIIRINPSVPHHTWSQGTAADAWMVFRHVSDMPTAISVDSASHPRAMALPPPRIFSEEELADDPARYALIAWGLAEKIRMHRELANLRIAQLADACDIDRSYLSRIESGHANVSLEALIRIARYLRVNIGEFLEKPPWAWMTEKLPSPGGNTRDADAGPRLCPDTPHFLHLSCVDVAGRSIQNVSADECVSAIPDGAFSSWIVLDGRVICKIGNTGELLEAGSVAHFRGVIPRTVQPLEPSRILTVLHSPLCPRRRNS